MKTFVAREMPFFLFFAGTIFITLILAKSGFLQPFIYTLGYLNIIGAFLAGLLFVPTFTIPLATIILLGLLPFMPSYEIALFAGLGATVGNLLLFHSIGHHLRKHTVKLQKTLNKHKKMKAQLKASLLHYHWSIPALGLVLLATPVPDEIGIGVLRLLHMKPHHFVVISYIVKTTIIMLLLSFPLIRL